jgi:DNA-binding NtrC family response regulator
VIFDLTKAARAHAPVLITRKSGTGKELARGWLHDASDFHAGLLVAVNCPGLSPTLVASEFFGHEKGAFSDAKEQKIGKIEAAQNGTLFLDEIADLPLELQGYLLRFLEDHTVVRVGGTRTLKINARVVAATNVDLRRRS